MWVPLTSQINEKPQVLFFFTLTFIKELNITRERYLKAKRTKQNSANKNFEKTPRKMNIERIRRGHPQVGVGPHVGPWGWLTLFRSGKSPRGYGPDIRCHP